MIKTLGRFYAWTGGLLACVWVAGAAETLPEFKVGSEVYRTKTLPVLKVAGEVYTNVTVKGITATDIYFEHACGIGSAKLKYLEPELQKMFDYNAAKAEEMERKQQAAGTRLKNTPTKNAPATNAPSGKDKSKGKAGKKVEDDYVAPDLHAKSFRGQPSPQIIVDEWLTSPPDVNGKFVLVAFWATTNAASRQAITNLNVLQVKFKDRLVVIGLSNESAETVRKLKSPKPEFAAGVDAQGRTAREAQVSELPHSLLVDPKGIVRFEGSPGYLTEQVLSRLVAKYSK